MNYTLINKEEDLKNYIDILKNSKCLAIDTEFIRNNKYYPQLSLLQICYNKQQAIIIDCLAIDNIDAIIDIIYDDNIIKIFHSCNQDLEIFYYKKQYLPKNIFDTQIACLMLNYQKDISYEKMVKILLDVEIDKKLRTSNWTIRPLSKPQIKYAAMDVLYLYECYEIIKNKIQDTKKLDVLHNIFKKLENPQRYLPKLEQQANKIILPEHSKEHKLIINVLVAWRDNMAKKINIAKHLLLSNDIIKEIATINDISMEILEPMLEQDGIAIYTKEIYQLIQNSQTDNSAVNLIFEANESILAKNHTYNLLKIILTNIAQQKDLNEYLISTIITNQEELKQVALSKNINIYKDWRYELFGKTLEDFFNGRISIKMINNEISLEYNNQI
jgi:ribonuclease D